MPSITQQSPKGPKKPADGGPLSRIIKVTRRKRAIKLALYGGSGSGKTRLACTFPKPLLILGAEDGTNSVSTDEGVFFVPLLDSQDVKVVCEAVAGKVEFPPDVKKFLREWKAETFATVVQDTGTMLQDLILKEILGLEEIPAQKSWGMASQQQYGQCSLKTKTLLRVILDLTDKQGINTVVICQERNFTEGKDSEVLAPAIGSALTPSVAGWLHPACDYVGQMFKRKEMAESYMEIGGKRIPTTQPTGKIEFCLRTGIHDVYATKFRLPRGEELPDVIVDPTYEKIVALIQGESE